MTFFAMISFQLYNQESIASIAVSFAVKLVILQSLFIIRSALRVRRLNIQMTNENRGLSCEEAQKRLYAGYGNVQVKNQSKSVGQIIAGNIFTYFNFIFAVFTALLVL